MTCDKCGKTVDRLRNEGEQWVCRDCAGAVHVRMLPFGTLAGNPYKPDLTLAHDRDMEKRTVEKDNGISRMVYMKPKVLYSFAGQEHRG